MIKKSLIGGKHQLTDKQTDTFQRYYGKAIRDSVGTSVLTMTPEIMSGFWHAISRDGDDGEGNHHHNHCDPSWCIFKRTINEGKPIPSHENTENYLRLEKKCEDRVRNIFGDLSRPAILERCLKGRNQNRNAGLHSKLWLHQNKAKSTGIKQVKLVFQLTIIEHNFD